MRKPDVGVTYSLFDLDELNFLEINPSRIRMSPLDGTVTVLPDKRITIRRAIEGMLTVERDIQETNRRLHPKGSQRLELTTKIV